MLIHPPPSCNLNTYSFAINLTLAAHVEKGLNSDPLSPVSKLDLSVLADGLFTELNLYPNPISSATMVLHYPTFVGGLGEEFFFFTILFFVVCTCVVFYFFIEPVFFSGKDMLS